MYHVIRSNPMAKKTMNLNTLWKVISRDAEQRWLDKLETNLENLKVMNYKELELDRDK